jgi:hypothetical protein
MTNEELIEMLKRLPMNAEVVVPVFSKSHPTEEVNSVVEVGYNESGNIEIIAL